VARLPLQLVKRPKGMQMNLVPLVVGGLFLLAADIAIIRRNDEKGEWLKVTARMQAFSLLVGAGAGIALHNPLYFEYGFVGVALSAIPILLSYMRQKSGRRGNA
jgi:hypothetical protein